MAGTDLPRDLRFIRTLVAVLAGTMILGLITIIVIFVTRFPDLSGAALQGPALPAGISLPAGARASAVTFGTGWIAVVTDQGDILIYDAATGALRQKITPEAGTLPQTE
ncbi:MAG: hypothetical protein KDE03_00455 [Rhodobacteraceae bacterium]|nr:hypothetical protein [Paracoccaceae bacterium]